MGFFDFLSKAIATSKKPVEEAKQQSPKTQPVAMPAVPPTTPPSNLDELESKVVFEKNLALEKTAPPKNKQTIAEINAEFEGLKSEVNSFLQKPLDPGMQHYKIAFQMKKDFEKLAMPTLESLSFPQQHFFEEQEKFSVQLVETIKAFTKLTINNRYLLPLFPEDFGKIGAKMKKIALLSDKLNAEIASAKDAAKKHFETLQEITAARALQQKSLQSQNAEKELEQSLENEKQKLDAAKAELEKKSALKEEREKISRMQSKQEALKEQMRALLSPYAHAFKKLSKNPQDRQAEKTAQKYASDPLKAAFEEEIGLPQLKHVLSMIDEKTPQDFIQKLSQLMQEISVLDTIKIESGKKLEPLLKAERELEYLEKNFALAQQKLSKAKQEANNALQASQSAFQKALEKANSLSNA